VRDQNDRHVQALPSFLADPSRLMVVEAVVGSSATSNCGSQLSATAIIARCCAPLSCAVCVACARAIHDSHQVEILHHFGRQSFTSAGATGWPRDLLRW